MKQFVRFFVACSFASLTQSSFLSAQCVDPSLINPNAICLMIWDPVCGCDGVTYSNECFAVNYGGVTSWTQGECTQGSGDCLDMANLDFGMCAMALGVAMVNGSCQYVSGCGYTASNGINYQSYFFETVESCQIACGQGCVDQSQIDWEVMCPAVWDPVCGCNGVTYSNECEAYYHGGVTSWTQGECGKGGNNCLDLGNLDFGPCDMLLGVAWVNGSCQYLSGCGYTATDGVNYQPYFFVDMPLCEQACNNCVDESQIDWNVLCPGVWLPVCGCNGVTYANECEAFYHGGVTSWTEGECTPSGYCLDLGAVDFGDCEMYLGVAYVGGYCQDVSGCGYVVDYIDYSPYFFNSIESCIAGCKGYDPGACTNPNPPANVACLNLPEEKVCGCDNVTYNNPCEAFYNGGIVWWTPGECETYIDGIVNNKRLLIHPNPVADYCTVSWPINTPWHMRLSDATGRTILSKFMNVNASVIDLSGLAAGIYLVECFDGKQIAQARLVKN